MEFIAKVKTPCIGVCSTGIGDSVCRGCKRYMHEVVSWNGYSEDERRRVIGRISHLLRQVSEPVIEIHDQEQLLSSLKFQGLRFDENADPYVWVLELLKIGASTMNDIEEFGCRVRESHAHLSLVDIRDQLDKDFFTLSEVHYERYFKGDV